MQKSNVLLVATCSLLLACQPGQSNVPVNVNSPSTTPTPTTAANNNLPPSDLKQVEYNGYPYSYKREGDTTVAMFVKRFLPRDDAIVVGAIRDVIHRAYEENALGTPYLVDTATSDGTATRAIRIDGDTNGYLIVPVKEDTGEIHSLTITRVAR